MCVLKDIRALCRAGAAAHAAGDALNADCLLQQAFGMARDLKSPVLEAKILNTLGVFALAGGRARAAVPLLAQARDKVKARIGDSNKLYAVIENNLRQAEEAAVSNAKHARTGQRAA